LPCLEFSDGPITWVQKRFSWPISAGTAGRQSALAATQARSAHSRNSWASMSWMRTSIPNLDMNIGQGVLRRNARNMGPKPVLSICKVGGASLCLNLYSTFRSAIVFKTIHYQGIPGLHSLQECCRPLLSLPMAAEWLVAWWRQHLLKDPFLPREQLLLLTSLCSEGRPNR
jgi:hypothetical protein